MRVPIKFLSHVFTVGVLFLATGAFLGLAMDVSNRDTLTKGNVVLQVVWLGIYVVVALRVLPRYREIISFMRSNRALVLLVALAILSTLWSGDPALTFRRSIAVLGTTLFGLDFAMRYSIREQLRMLSFALGLAVFLSVVVQVCWPDLIPTIDPGYAEGWNGAFEQKNIFARIVVLTMLTFIVGSSGRWKFFKNSVVVFGAVALVVATKSKTALVVLAGILVMLAAIKILISIERRRVAYLVSTVLGLLGVQLVCLAWVNLSYVTGLLGRDPTLTGRVSIWRLGLKSFLERPLLGYGYDGFWNVSSDALRINGALHWSVPHAHNGFLDLALQLGLVGLCLYLAYYAVSVRRAFRYAQNATSTVALWPLAYLVFALFYGVTERSPLSSNSLFWILYASVAYTLSAAVRSADPAIVSEPLELPDPQLNERYA